MADLGRPAAGRAPHERTDARLQLAEVEGLDQVVVGPGIESGDPVGNGVARGEDQHRRRVVAPPQGTQHLEPGEPRQPEVEDDEREPVGAQRCVGRRAVPDPVDRVTLLGETGAQPLTEQRVVLDQQDAHGAF